jgi:hypothetical protein
MAKRKIISKNAKEFIAAGIMIVSTSIIIFNNVGQSLQLVQLNFSRNAYYWIAGISFGVGAVWISYLNKLIKIN